MAIKDTTLSDPIISNDYFLTLIDLAQVDISADVAQKFKGISLKTLVDGKETNRNALYWHYPHYHIEGAKPYSAIRKGKYKLIHNIEDNSYELYDLDSDIGEQYNLAKKIPQQTEALKMQLEEWKSNVKAQMPTPNPNFDPERRNKK